MVPPTQGRRSPMAALAAPPTIRQRRASEQTTGERAIVLVALIGAGSSIIVALVGLLGGHMPDAVSPDVVTCPRLLREYVGVLPPTAGQGEREALAQVADQDPNAQKCGVTGDLVMALIAGDTPQSP